MITTVSREGCLPTVSREGCWVSSARQTAWTNTWFPLLQPLWPVVTMRPPVPVRAQIGRLVRERKRQLWLLTPTKLCEGHAHLPWHPSAAEYGRGAAQVHQAYASCYGRKALEPSLAAWSQVWLELGQRRKKISRQLPRNPEAWPPHPAESAGNRVRRAPPRPLSPLARPRGQGSHL